MVWQHYLIIRLIDMQLDTINQNSVTKIVSNGRISLKRKPPLKYILMFAYSREKTDTISHAILLNDEYGRVIREGKLKVMLTTKNQFIHWRRRGF